jgi:hypothetical protein
MAHRAQDTFVIELDGTPRRINKGDILPDSDEVVRHDQASGGSLFVRMNYGEDEADAAPKTTRGRKAAS